MSEGKWPYRAIHITNDGEACAKKNPERSDLGKLTGVGIISNKHLQGIQKSICAKLENPTTIVEFSPEGEFVRNDSRLLVFGLHPACTIFRRYTAGEECLRCDKAHAFLIYDLKKDNLRREVDRRIDECEYIRKYRLADENIHFDFVTDVERPYLEYDCPLLGYRELLFPVFFEGRVIAVFFCGELCLKERLEFIYEKQKELSGKQKFLFSDYCNADLGLSVEAIGKEILEAHKNCVRISQEQQDEKQLSTLKKVTRKILDEKQYEDLKNDICSELNDLENTLEEQMSLQRNRYVRKRMERRIKKFRKMLPTKENSSAEKWDMLWQNTKERLDELCSEFAIKYIVAFADKGFEKGAVSSLDVVVKAGSLPAEIKEKIDSGRLRFHMDKLPETIRHKWCTSKEDKRILDAIEGFPGQLSTETNLIRVLPVPFFPQASLVILVGHYDWNPLTSEENRASAYSSVTALGPFYMVVLSTLSSVLADSSEDRLKRTLRVQHHEINNSIQVLYQRMSQVLREIPKETLGQEAIKLGFKNIEEGLKLLEQHTIWPRFLAGKYSVNTTRVPVVAMMHRWRDFYAPEVRAKCLTVKVPPADAQDPERPKPVADAELLELAVSN